MTEEEDSEKEAKRLYKEGKKAELGGDLSTAISFYKRAEKMGHNLEEEEEEEGEPTIPQIPWSLYGAKEGESEEQEVEEEEEEEEEEEVKQEGKKEEEHFVIPRDDGIGKTSSSTSFLFLLLFLFTHRHHSSFPIHLLVSLPSCLILNIPHSPFLFPR
jgi:hypothetical protein